MFHASLGLYFRIVNAATTGKSKSKDGMNRWDLRLLFSPVTPNLMQVYCMHYSLNPNVLCSVFAAAYFILANTSSKIKLNSIGFSIIG